MDEPPADSAGTPAPQEAAAEQEAWRKTLERHVSRLSSEQFKERRTAQEELLAWGRQNPGEGIEALYRLYKASDDPEVQLRSRDVLRRLVIEQQPFTGEGYLGIQMDTKPVQAQNGDLQLGVLVTMVREGTAAEAAKLEEGDVIVGVDDLILDNLAPTQTFGDYVRKAGAGNQVTLHVRRGKETLKLPATLRRRSPLLDRVMPFNGLLPELPPQEEMDELDFQEWLQEREERARPGR